MAVKGLVSFRNTLTDGPDLQHVTVPGYVNHVHADRRKRRLLAATAKGDQVPWSRSHEVI